MLKKVIRFFIYFSYIVGITIFLVEAASQLYVRIIRSDLIASQEIENYQSFNLVKGWQSTFKASPYFGYVIQGGNNYGFDSDDNFPIKKSENTYVIAIAGGSVANHFANYISLNEQYVDKLKQLIPYLKNKDIRIMNLSIAGYRQPQQFFTVSYFIDNIDLLIQLDGWNEAWARTANKFPADYPTFSEILYGDELSNKVSQIKDDKEIIDLIKQNKILNKSCSLLLFRNILQKRINKKSEDLLNDDKYLFYNKAKTEGQLKDITTTAWSKYLKMEQSLLNLYNKKFFFFIQPNQYNDNSKPFSPKEKQIAFAQNINTVESAIAFKNLRKEGEKLKVWDLVSIFKTTPDDIYVDDCCHMNKKGNQILTEEIFRIISTNF